MLQHISANSPVCQPLALARKILCILYHLLMNQEMNEFASLLNPNSSKDVRGMKPSNLTTHQIFIIVEMSKN